MFQYSLTNLVWCNGHGRYPLPTHCQFQYSLTNLVWCNCKSESWGYYYK